MARASSNVAVPVYLHKDSGPYTDYGLNESFNLTTGWQSFSTEFTATGFSGSVNNGRLRFWLAGVPNNTTLFFDNIVLEEAE